VVDSVSDRHEIVKEKQRSSGVIISLRTLRASRPIWPFDPSVLGLDPADPFPTFRIRALSRSRITNQTITRDASIVEISLSKGRREIRGIKRVKYRSHGSRSPRADTRSDSARLQRTLFSRFSLIHLLLSSCTQSDTQFSCSSHKRAR